MRYYLHPESCSGFAQLQEIEDEGDGLVHECSHLEFLDAWAKGFSITFPKLNLHRRDPEHVYVLDCNEVPSVSSIIEHLYDFRFVKADVLEKARDYGKKVHRTIELAHQQRLNRDTLHPALLNPLKGWEKWCRDFGFIALGFEVSVAHRRYRYAGTMDTFGVQMDSTGRTECAMLPDVKTGAHYAPHKLQTAGYRLAGADMGLLPADTRRGSVYLFPDSDDYDWIAHPHNMDEAAFLGLNTAHHWEKHHGK